MASLDKIKQRMKTINSTSKITKAMELVATAKLKKAKNEYLEVVKYWDVLRESINNIFHNFKNKNKKFSDITGNTLWIILSSDLGLCGGYNINGIRLFLKNHHNKDKVLVVGQKGMTICKSFNIKIEEGFAQIINNFQFDLAQGIIQKALEVFENDDSLTKLKLVATKFVNNAMFTPEIINLLPIISNDLEKKEEKKIHQVRRFEPEQEIVIKKTIPLYLSFLLYEKVLEAKLIEQSSRRMAMESATKNANEIISDLKIKYNRQRQANITQEISEIIAGANS